MIKLEFKTTPNNFLYQKYLNSDVILDSLVSNLNINFQSKTYLNDDSILDSLI